MYSTSVHAFQATGVDIKQVTIAWLCGMESSDLPCPTYLEAPSQPQ